MRNSIRWRAYALLGVGGLCLSIYVFFMVFTSLAERKYLTEKYIFFAVGLMLVAASLSNFYISYGMKFGTIDRVFGSRKSATMVKNEQTVKEGGRIQIWVNLDRDDGSLSDEEKTVLFLCDWKPWTCALRDFTVDDIVKKGR